MKEKNRLKIMKRDNQIEITLNDKKINKVRDFKLIVNPYDISSNLSIDVDELVLDFA